MNCPFCNTVIYHLGFLTNGVYGKSNKDPSMYHKDGNMYVDCPSCSKPVLLQQVSSPAGIGHVVNPNQNK